MDHLVQTSEPIDLQKRAEFFAKVAWHFLEIVISFRYFNFVDLKSTLSLFKGVHFSTTKNPLNLIFSL